MEHLIPGLNEKIAEAQDQRDMGIGESTVNDLMKRLNDKTLYYDMPDGERELVIAALAHIQLAMSFGPLGRELFMHTLKVFHEEIDRVMIIVQLGLNQKN